VTITLPKHAVDAPDDTVPVDESAQDTSPVPTP
jgi:hypothetical protein